MTEAILTGETKGLRLFQEQSMKGEYGRDYQLFSETGEFWSEYGIIRGIKEFGQSVKDARQKATDESTISDQNIPYISISKTM